MFLRKGALKICSKFIGEHSCRSAISIKLQSNFIEIALEHGCSPVNLLQIFRTPFPRNTSGWLFQFEKKITLMILGMEIDCTSNNKQATIAKVTHSHYIQIKKVFRGTYIGIWLSIGICTAHKMKFSIKDFFSKCDQICRRLGTWSHLLNKLLMENFIFCAMTYFSQSQSTFNIFKKKRPITIRSVP